MSRLRNLLQHSLNPVHVYCRLVDCRVSCRTARSVAAAWERWVYARPRRALVFVIALICLVSCSVPAQAKHLHTERVYQEHWCAAQPGTLEVSLPGGLRIDCETVTHAVEVDFAPKWAEAVGQSLAYAAATGKRPGILLILEMSGDSRHLAKLRSVIDAFALPIDVWTITPDEVAQ